MPSTPAGITLEGPQRRGSSSAGGRPPAEGENASGIGRSSNSPGGFTPLTILFVTVFLDLVGFGIVIPLLPLYAERFGASPVGVTWLVAIYSLMQFLFAPWWGQLSDRIGRRPVLLVGLFGSASSYLIFGLAGSLAVLFLARALAGIMGANIGVAQAYVSDVTAPEERARGMGLIGAAFGLGFIFGPVIGGGLSYLGPSAPFFGAGLLALVNGVCAVVWLPEPRRTSARVPAGIALDLRARLKGFTRMASRTDGAVLLTSFFLVTFAFAALEATFSIWADRRWQLTPAGIAYTFAYLGVVITIVQGALVGPLVRKMGELRLAVIGAGALIVGLTGIPLAPTTGLLALALAALAFGQGTFVPSISALISRHAGPGEQGRLLGISQSLSALGRVLGPLWGGLAFAKVGIGAPYLSGAVVVAFALALLAGRGAGLARGT